MNRGLLVFRGLTHDSQGGLARVLGRLAGPVRPADVLDERFLLGRRGVGREWHLTNRATLCPLVVDQMRDCPVLPRHAIILPRLPQSSTPVETAPVLLVQLAGLRRWKFVII